MTADPTVLGGPPSGAAGGGRPLLHQSLHTFGVQAAVLALSLVSGAVVARWLGPVGKGQLALAMLVPSVLALLLGGGLGAANIYFLGSRHLGLQRLTANSIGFGLLASLAGVTLALPFVATGALERWMPGVPAALILLALVALPLTVLSSCLSGLLLGLQRILAVNRIQLAQNALSTGLLVALVGGIGGGVAAAIAAFLLAAAGALMAQALLVRRLGGRLAPRLERDTLAPALAYGWRAQAGAMLQFFNYRLDVFIVNYLAGVEQVGIYGVAVSLAELLWQWPNAVGLVLFPRVSASDPRETNRLTPRVLRWTLLLTLAGALALTLVGPMVIRTIFGARFAGAYVPMLILLPGVVLLGGGKVLTSAIAGRGHPGLNSINAAAALVVTLGGNLLLVPRYGISGAALASSVAYTLNFLLAVFFYGQVRRRG
jgi:O-antigen/teichoic acid export membrane protein